MDCVIRLYVSYNPKLMNQKKITKKGKGRIYGGTEDGIFQDGGRDKVVWRQNDGL